MRTNLVKKIAALAVVALASSGCLYGVVGDGYAQHCGSYNQWLAQGWVRANTDGENWRIISGTGIWDGAEYVPSPWAADYSKVNFSRWTSVNGAVGGVITVQAQVTGETASVWVDATKPEGC